MAYESNRGISRRAVLGGAAGIVIAPPGASMDRSLVSLRRDLHRHPEIAGQERRTAGVVAQRLRAAGLDVTTSVGGHGVVGVLTGARSGRTVAYRADMDAVAPPDQIEGSGAAAHVCGHDIHTTVGVGVAEALARSRARLSGRVVFVFQPAEETLAGAAAMLADGVLTSTRPEEIHALHCGPFPVGEFVVTPGSGLPGQDRGVISCAGPDAAVQLATDLNALSTVSRPETPADLEDLVADVQKPHGPLARFVFLTARAEQSEVRVSYRCWPEHRYPEVRKAIRKLAGDATVSFPNAPFPALIAPEREAGELQRYLHRTVGRKRTRVAHAAFPFNGEDFALFLDRLPGTYTYLGVQRPGTGIETSFPHFGTFQPDERAIGHGVRTMAGWLATRTRRLERV